MVVESAVVVLFEPRAVSSSCSIERCRAVSLVPLELDLVSPAGVDEVVAGVGVGDAWRDVDVAEAVVWGAGFGSGDCTGAAFRCCLNLRCTVRRSGALLM